MQKVKQIIVDTLTGIKRIRSELERKGQKLEASILEIDALGMIWITDEHLFIFFTN